MRLEIRLLTLVILGFSLISSYKKCEIGDGKYRVHFQTKGFEDYDLIISNVQYTKILNDGSTKSGTLGWLENCILILTDHSESKKKEPLVAKIETGLGEQCMQLLRKKGETIYFRTTRVANQNIVINEGKLIKQR